MKTDPIPTKTSNKLPPPFREWIKAQYGRGRREHPTLNPMDSKPFHDSPSMKESKCASCGKPGHISLAGKRFYCRECDPDPSGWTALAEAKRKGRERNRQAIYNIAKKMGVLDRIEIQAHGGSCLLDGKVYYYAQKKKARKKGSNKTYQMRGVQHFFDVFLSP